MFIHLKILFTQAAEINPDELSQFFHTDILILPKTIRCLEINLLNNCRKTLKGSRTPLFFPAIIFVNLLMKNTKVR